MEPHTTPLVIIDGPPGSPVGLIATQVARTAGAPLVTLPDKAPEVGVTHLVAKAVLMADPHTPLVVQGSHWAAYATGEDISLEAIREVDSWLDHKGALQVLCLTDPDVLHKRQTALSRAEIGEQHRLYMELMTNTPARVVLLDATEAPQRAGHMAHNIIVRAQMRAAAK